MRFSDGGPSIGPEENRPPERRPGEPLIQAPLLELIEQSAKQIRKDLTEKFLAEYEAIQLIPQGRYEEAIAKLRQLHEKQQEADRARDSVPQETRAVIEAAVKEARRRPRTRFEIEAEMERQAWEQRYGELPRPSDASGPRRDDRNCPGYDEHAIRTAWLEQNEQVLHHARSCKFCYEILRVIEETAPGPEQQ